MDTTDPARSLWPGQGFSLIELMFVLGLLATVTGMAIPRLDAALEEMRALGAVRYLSARLQQTRIEALVRNASVAFRIVPDAESYSYASYVDGNRNGVRNLDTERGL